MTGIFVSYRRADSRGWTGRLCDYLVERFGRDAVFYDVDSIGIGEDFVSAIQQHVSQCKALLVVIGPHWVNATTPDGMRRLDQAHDHVLAEIQLAIANHVPLLPLLVDDASMPGPSDLPASIAMLANQNALVISDVGFNNDMEQLVQAIKRLTGLHEISPAPPTHRASALRSRLRDRRVLLATALIVLSVAGISLLAITNSAKHARTTAAGLQAAAIGKESSQAVTTPPAAQAESARRALSQLHLDYSAEDFLASVAKGDVNAVSLFLAAGMDPNATADDEDSGTTVTPLMRAAAKGDELMVSTLLKAGADINLKQADGETALTYAVISGKTKVIQLLLDKGSNTASINNAFIRAAAHRNHSVLRLLAQHGVDLKRASADALMAAVQFGGWNDAQRTETMNLLFELGITTKGIDNTDYGPLHAAANEGYAAAVTLLLNNGAAIDARCECPGIMDGGWTPLLLAAQARRAEVTEVLLARGANVNVTNNNGQNALILAAKEGDPPILEAILTANPEVNAAAKNGITALMQLSSGVWWPDGVIITHPEFVRALLARGANVNAKDHEGRTALMFAARSGSNDVVRALLDKGARPEDKDNKGATAADYARDIGNAAKTAEIIKLLHSPHPT